MLIHGPNPVSGTSAQANWLNRLLAAVRANKILPGVGYKVKYSSNGTILEVTPGKGGDTSKIRRLIVNSVQGDYVTCRTWDGDTEGDTDILVAKPPHLRHSLTSQTVNGESVTYSSYAISGGVCTRTASATGFDDQTEMVIPQWQTGSGQDSEIFAAEPDEGTDVEVDEVELTLLDINVDARAWCQTNAA